MIPITKRSAPRVLRALCARQALPRPARFYSSPSKSAQAPALASAPLPTSEYPAYMSTPQKPKSDQEEQYGLQEMLDFLTREQQYTVLPTPLPENERSTLNDMYFPETPMQDQVSIIDACLYNGYDVPRAKEIFERIREEERMSAQLTPRLYDAVLSGYIHMAVKDTQRSDNWVEDALSLYDVMETGQEKVQPSPNTYANMLLLWMRVQNGLTGPLSAMTTLIKPVTLLRRILDREIPVTLVISDRAFTSDEEAASAIKILSKAAVEANLPNLSKVIMELGTIEALGTLPEESEVPEVMPVTRPKTEVKATADGDIAGTEVADADAGPQEEVPFNLATLRKHLADVILARKVLSGDNFARQKLLEASVYDVAVQRLKHQAETLEHLGIGSKGLEHAELKALLWNWHQKLTVRLKAEVALLIKEEDKSTAKAHERLSPYLSLVKPESMSLIVILELMHLHGTGGIAEGMKTARALLAVGRAVEIEYKAQMCKRNNISIPQTTRNDLSFFSTLGYRDLHTNRVTARKFIEDSEDWTSDWSQAVRVRLGSFLVDALMDVATVTRTATNKDGEKVSEEQPAFYHSYEYVRGHKLGVIKLNPVISERMAKESVREALHPRHLPMLVQPKRWVSFNEGGYIYNKATVMRYKDSQEQLSYLKEASNLGNLELVYAGLDVLGSTPWKINREVFDIVLRVWNSGKRLGKIPPVAYDEPEPEKPENYDTDPRARAVYLGRHKSYLTTKANNHSDRCSTNYKIEIARTFLHDTFYLPHNVDFRGRAYPLPPHLNHIGDDLSRGLLKFAEAKPLKESGLRWLKIHLANLYGYDKGTFDERVNFVHEHLEDVYDSAERPLEGRRWWQKADDPWQCLATCIELRAALQSDDPAMFLSSLPVHQDGTCNGLQHYAALGGDEGGAQQVNLSVTDRPSDVYTHVADMVEEQLKKDAAEGDPFAQLLSGKISRKVVKQTVMTTVYGVTFIGAREQIENRLKERSDIPEEQAWRAASYLARKVLICIADLFNGAKGIQLWLNTAARLITKSIPPDRVEVALAGPAKDKVKRLRKEQMTSVIWTTPLGLPIVQPYRAVKRKQIMTALQTVFISDPNTPASVNSTKQAAAFPPNFIHSLDATHMMMTALECRSRNMTFASVHDSYWTHACDVDEMSTIIRDTFIALHSSDILSKLDAEFRMRYKDFKIPMFTLTKDQQEKINKMIARGGQDGGKPLDPVFASEEAAEGDSVEAATEESASEEHAASDRNSTRFLNLVDLLPPLPEKGHFDVSTIKKSLYFFS
ncbi:DNA/RNA polymerase [Trametopsis cervina]|nr:DNA/RNA polymerase [Trametopsis cervina]